MKTALIFLAALVDLTGLGMAAVGSIWAFTIYLPLGAWRARLAVTRRRADLEAIRSLAAELAEHGTEPLQEAA